jgi:glycosyltransferase involved in cell wall biosynthesis
MLVSVIIPAFKHSRFILATLQSVFSQTFKELEVIVVNDGSPDDTREVLKPLVASGQIRYFEQENAGQAAARNRGLSEARGEYVAFLDDDDEWPPDKLEWQVAQLRQNDGVPLIGGGAVRIDASGTVLTEWCYGPISLETADLFRGPPFISPGQTLIRRSALMQIGGFDPEIWGADDYDLYLRLSQCGPLLVEPRVALHYRVHASNASSQHMRMFKNSRSLLRKHSRWMSAANRREAHRWLYYYSGGPAAIRLKAAIRSGRVQAAAEALQILVSFVPACLRDAQLSRSLLQDLAPAPLRSAWQARNQIFGGGHVS